MTRHFKLSASVLSISLSVSSIALIASACSSKPNDAFFQKTRTPPKFFQSPDLTALAADILAGRLPTPRYHIYAEKIIRIDTGIIRYIETGLRENQTLLFMHGATFRAELWKDLGTMHYFSRLGYHVVSADLPGHGKSTRPPIAHNHYLKRFIDALDLETPIIIGHSYAGAYILPFLSQHPGAARASVLIAPTNVRQYIDGLKKSHVPTLILWGAKDEMISVHQANLLHKAMKNSLLKILPGAQHECYNTNTVLFHSEIESFLENLRISNSVKI